jgi:hypothetical protein
MDEMKEVFERDLKVHKLVAYLMVRHDLDS